MTRFWPTSCLTVLATAKGADGFRTLPDGKPLTVKIHSAPHARDVTKMEVWRNSLKKIGVRGQFPVAGFADNLKAAYLCQLPMFGLGGTASLPDASDFMSAYYGPNQLRGNFGCYQSKQFDEAFARARLLPDNAERRAALPQNDAYSGGRWRTHAATVAHP